MNNATTMNPIHRVRSGQVTLKPPRRSGPRLEYIGMLFFVAFAYCSGVEIGNGAEPERLQVPVGTPAPSPLTLRVIIPERIGHGESVPMHLILENRGEEPIQLGLGGEPIAFNFVVRNADGREVWSRLDGIAIESILRVKIIQPGEIREFSDVWHQQSSDGGSVPPGEYHVYGVLPVVDEPGGWVTVPETVRVEG